MRNGFVEKLNSPRTASNLEAAFLSLTLLVLPLFEAPKNIFSLAFFVVWIVQARRTRSIGAKSSINWPLLGLAAILWISPFSSAHGDIFSALSSAPRWTVLAMFVIAAARLDYSRSQLVLIFSALLAGGVSAVVESFWVWQANGKPFPEFRSVGHVNHSAMYTLVPLAIGLGMLFSGEKFLRGIALLAIISTLLFLPPSRSLVVGVAIISILISAASLVLMRRWTAAGFWVSITAIVLVITTVLVSPPSEGLRAEFMERITGDNLFSGRDRIINSALAVWDHNPIFGTGWNSFSVATSEAAVRAALSADGQQYDPNIYFHLPHGHNLWVTILVERGLVGVALVTILLFLYFKTFLPIAISRDELEPLDRGVAFAALLVTVGFTVAGLGNTTMMNEHGHAGMASIAVAYGYLRGRRLL